jgi:hypothetical protein
MHIDPAKVIRRIGAMPIGDPVAMRSHATRLHADANHLTELVGAAHRRAHAAVYRGPAADRFRAGIDDCLHVTQQKAGRLHQAADDLARAAGGVESAQRSWTTMYHRVESELAAAARAAMGR